MIQFDWYFSIELKPPTTEELVNYHLLKPKTKICNPWKSNGWKISFPIEIVPFFRGQGSLSFLFGVEFGGSV